VGAEILFVMLPVVLIHIENTVALTPGETVRDFFIDLLGDGGHDPRRPTVVYQDEDFIFDRQDWPPPWRDESLAVAIITVVERGS
jgi:hypothetical protein